MRALHAIAVGCILSLCVAGQEAATDLRALRAAFEGAADGTARVAIALVGSQDPILLCDGPAGDTDMSSATLLPLGAAARLLIADALLTSSTAAELDASVGRIGGEEVTLRTMLQGYKRLPDWFALGPVAHAPDRATLLRCAEVADLATTSFHTTSFHCDPRGVAELTVLEPTLFADQDLDWPRFLRTRLSPRGAGIDPLDAAHPVRDWKLAPAAREVVKSPVPSLRLLLSGRDVAAWWDWRVRNDLAPWSGPRSGRDGWVDGLAQEPRWTWSADHGAFAWQIAAYPRRRAALIEFRTADAASLRPVFEECLFGPPPPTEDRFGGRSVSGPSRDALRGSWIAQGGADARIDVRGLFGLKVRFQCDGETFAEESLSRWGRSYQVGLRGTTDGRTGELLLWLDGKGEDERLLVVFVRREPTSAVPLRVDFARAR